MSDKSWELKIISNWTLQLRRYQQRIKAADHEALVLDEMYLHAYDVNTDHLITIYIKS